MSGSALSAVAKTIGNPTCAHVLDALLSERRMTVTLIADEIGTARSTVSEAVTALSDAGLVTRHREGRATIVRLATPEVAEALEALGRIGQPPAAIGLRPVRRMHDLRCARTCYDHLAGEIGVKLTDALLTATVLSVDDDGNWRLTEHGRGLLMDLGIDSELIGPHGRRALVRSCLDWTERRPHVAGRLGAAICASWLETGIVVRIDRSRALTVTEDADAWIQRLNQTKPRMNGGDGRRNTTRQRIAIRPAQASDTDFVAGLAPALLRYGSPAWPDPMRFAPGFQAVLADAVAGQDERAPVFIAEGADGVRLGFISLKTNQHIGGIRRGHVADLAVVEDARRTGVGRELMKTAETWARQQGMSIVSLDVWAPNEPARSFYADLGYTPEALNLIKVLSD